MFKIYRKKTVNKLRISDGYTIIELLVSISIIAVISGVFLMNYKAADRQFLLNQAVQQVASDLRQAQNYALGQKEFNGTPPEGGWGIYFRRVNPNDEYYILFADTATGSEAHLYDSGELYGNGNKKEIFLPKDIVINNNFFDSTPPGKVNATVTFIAPDASVWLCDDVTNCTTNNYNELEIELEDTKTGNTKRIKMNKYGLIDIN